MSTEKKTIKFKDRETVYSTDQDKQHKTGTPIKVHPVQADALVKAGKFTRTAPAKGAAKKQVEA